MDEGLRDFSRNTRRVGVGDVGDDGYDDPVLRERHERRHLSSERIAVVADDARLSARQGNGLEIPAKTVTRFLPGRQPL